MNRPLDHVRQLIKDHPGLQDTRDLQVLEDVANLLTVAGLETLTFYERLEVGNDADHRAIQNNYRRLSKEFHPDLHKGSRFHTEVFKLLNEAYTTLTDPERRTRYDHGYRTQREVDCTTLPFQGRASDNKEWVMVLATAVGTACYCKTMFYEQARQVIYIGSDTNREAAATLYPWIYHQMDRLCDKAYRSFWPSPEELWPGVGELPESETKWAIVQKIWQRIPKRAEAPKEGDAPVHWRTFRRSFMAGAVDKVSERLREFRRGIQHALVRRTDAENQEFAAERWGKTKARPTRPMSVDHASYTKGSLAGRQVRLHHEDELSSRP